MNRILLFRFNRTPSSHIANVYDLNSEAVLVDHTGAPRVVIRAAGLDLSMRRRLERAEKRAEEAEEAARAALSALEMVEEARR